jgi:hypothetical protein
MTTAMLLLALAAPANGAIELQGLHAYPDRESVPAGESIRFHVSSRVPYRFGQQKTGTLVDMIYWERPQGGTVFNAGAIGFGWALDADPKLTKLLRNVLHHLAGVTARTPYDPEWLDPPK